MVVTEVTEAIMETVGLEAVASKEATVGMSRDLLLFTTLSCITCILRTWEVSNGMGKAVKCMALTGEITTA